MTRDDARAYFTDHGLSYQDITLNELKILEFMLNVEFNGVVMLVGRGLREKPLYWERINSAKYYKGKYDPNDGHMLHAFMTAKGTYFTARQVISFNPNGYIEFCSEADDENTEPVIKAFVQWCDWLKKNKENNL